MKSLEDKLAEAARRASNAEGEEWRLTREINYHDAEASRLRKERQKARNKKDRAKATVEKLAQQIHEEL